MARAYPEVTRFEVIDQTGRRLTLSGVDRLQVWLQDEGRTMKVFLRTEEEE